MIYIYNKFLFDCMDVQIRELTKTEANLSITDGDIGVLYIAQHELLNNPGIEFAGVITRHPLTNELWMRVVSSTPIKNIIKATDSALSKTSDLKKLLTAKIKAN